MTKLLISYGALPNLDNQGGIKPKDLARQFHHTQIVQLLEEAES
jgi:hypothetical protein